MTGFRPFGLYGSNSTGKLANEMHGQVLYGYHICGLAFETSMRVASPDRNCGEEIVGYAEDAGASAIISFGMSSTVLGLRVEGMCSNWVDCDKYCDPQENCQPITAHRPARETLAIDLVPWNVPRVYEELKRRQIPCEFEVSQNAGGFCCNALMYLTLCAMERRKKRLPFLFGHVPCSPQAVRGIPLEQFDSGKKVLIKEGMLKEMLEVILQNFTQAG